MRVGRFGQLSQTVDPVVHNPQLRRWFNLDEQHGPSIPPTEPNFDVGTESVPGGGFSPGCYPQIRDLSKKPGKVLFDIL